MNFEIFIKSLCFETPCVRKSGFYESVCPHAEILVGRRSGPDREKCGPDRVICLAPGQ